MKFYFLAFTLSVLTIGVDAQVQDLHSPNYDSTSTRINQKIDSLQNKLNNITNPSLNTLTSKFKNRKTNPTDSLKSLHEYDSLKTGLTHKIDSLNALNLPTNKYSRKLDSLEQLGPQKYIQAAQQRKQQLENKVNKPITDINQKINQPVDQLEQKINQPVSNIEGKVNEKLDLMRSEGGEGANLPGNLAVDKASLPGAGINNPLDGKTDTNIPGLKNPVDDLNVDSPLNRIDNPVAGKMDDVNGLKEKATDLKSVPQQQLDRVKSIDEVQTATDKVSDVNKATDKIQAYEGDVKNIAQGNVGEVKELPNAIENKAKALDEVKELEKQTGELNKAKEMVGVGQDPGALKDVAVKQATNHFAGKEEVLMNAMEKISKLKSKYSNVTSLADLPKRPPNPLKGKPLIERIVPGLTLQIQKSVNFMVDINPVIAYRINGHINAGLGWNERFSFTKWDKLNPVDRIFGPRVFSNYMFGKGWSVKTDIEKMNAVIPMSSLNPDAGARQWVWSIFVGLKKDYKFMGKVNGNVQILYNIFDDHDNSPYADRLNVRMGFEFPMKKKKRPVGQ